MTPWSSDCTQFQRCANGITYVFSCGPGTVFNPNLRVCDYPYNVPQPCTVGGSSSGCAAASTAAPTAATTAASGSGGSAVSGARKKRQTFSDAKNFHKSIIAVLKKYILNQLYSTKIVKLKLEYYNKKI